MSKKQIVFEFYDKLIQSIEPGKEYTPHELRKLSEDIIEKQLRPIYRETIDRIGLKERIPFMLTYLMNLLGSEGPLHAVRFYFTSVSKEKLQEALKDWEYFTKDWKTLPVNEG
jgi:hypothetical protein